MRVVGVLRQPACRIGERLVGVSAEKVEGVAGFVDEDGQVAVDAVEHCDVAGPIVSVGHGGCTSMSVRYAGSSSRRKAAYGQGG